MKFIRLFLSVFVLIYNTNYFVNGNKYISCEFIDESRPNHKYIECKSSIAKKLKTCNDPSDLVLEELFAKNEFKYINIINQISGATEFESELNSFLRFKQNIADSNELAVGHYTLLNCDFKDFRAYNTRSICPWNEIITYRDNVYPKIRRAAKCIKNCGDHCKNITVTETTNKKWLHHKCSEIEKLELILYRSECESNGVYKWEVGLEYVSTVCSCVKFEKNYRN